MRDCYIAIAPCGCIKAAVVNSPEHQKDVFNAVAGWTRAGFRIEQRTVEAAKADPKFMVSCDACKTSRRRVAKKGIPS